MTLFGALLLLLSFLLWAGCMANLFSLNRSDQAGNGLSYSFGILLLLALWGLLAVLLCVAAMKGEIPTWSKGCAFLLLPVSGAASLAAVEVLSRRGSAVRWPILVPALSGVIIMIYAVSIAVPVLRTAVSADAAGMAAWGTILVLSLLPWPTLIRTQRAGAANRSRVHEMDEIQVAQEAEQKRQENLAKFKALTPETHLWEWLNLANERNELRKHVIAGIRKLPRRQTDAEEMIERGIDLPMLELRHLDLEPTPKLFALAADFLRKDAVSFRLKAAGEIRFGLVAQRIERHLHAMHWLAAHGCELWPVVVAYESAAKLFPASQERALFLSQLERVRTTPLLSQVKER